MPAVVAVPPVKPGNQGTPSASPAAPAAVEFRYTQTDGFVELLHRLGAPPLASTYQTNKLPARRGGSGGLSTLVRTFDKPMGLAAAGGRLALGTRQEVWFLRNAPDIAPRIEPAGRHDACYLPRSAHVTGDIGVHEIAWASSPLSPRFGGRGVGGEGGEELWLVNTRVNCLCTLHPDYSLVPRWRPPFVTVLAGDDRCHLNGLAIAEGRPRYVTALGETDTANGWRANKPRGGVLMEMNSGEVISRGLSMPHSPRWHDSRLWLLESGAGQLVLVDPASGRRQRVAELPGFARGLALVGPYALIGLSRIRKTSAMDGVPLAQRREQLKCGVAVVDLRGGRVVALLEFQTAVEEIFDVQLLPGLRFP